MPASFLWWSSGFVLSRWLLVVISLENVCRNLFPTPTHRTTTAFRGGGDGTAFGGFVRIHQSQQAQADILGDFAARPAGRRRPAVLLLLLRGAIGTVLIDLSQGRHDFRGVGSGRVGVHAGATRKRRHCLLLRLL